MKRSTWLLYLSTVLITIPSFGLPSRATANPLQDNGSVTINNIDVSGGLSIRGLSSGFPYPVLTTISVVDGEGNPVTGLADSSRWLGPGDIAENGLPVEQIWSEVLEFHQEDTLVPPNPNVFDQVPPPLFTEVRQTTFLPTNTILVMDFSGSMVEEIDDAKAGARQFVRLMRPSDRTGIIQFAGSILSFQPLTSDTTLLIQNINDGELGDGTALRDAIIAGIHDVKEAPGRNGVIAYTDGRDNASIATVNAVIDSANAYGVPVFTIALGSQTIESGLRAIAERTGGLFFKAATASEMAAIYTELSALIRNFYVMAHASPDPVRNNTFRVVDITIDIPGFTGSGQGIYFVDGSLAESATDLQLDLSSATERSVTVGGRTYGAVSPGGEFTYDIRIRNLGPAVADSAEVFLFLPDSVTLFDASRPPVQVGDDVVAWHYATLSTDFDSTIVASVRLASDAPESLTELIASAHVSSASDSFLVNNTAYDTVRVIPRPPPPDPNYDLALTQTVDTDTSIVVAGEQFPAVRQGEVFDYQLSVENLGPGKARGVTLFDVLPDSLTLVTSNPALSFRSDTLLWMIDSLAAEEVFNIALTVRVADRLRRSPLRLFNPSFISAALDTNAVNDSAATTIYAVGQSPDESPFSADLRLDILTQTDSSVVVAGDIIKLVRIGETYRYTLAVSNDSSLAAEDVRLTNFFSSEVTVANFSLSPATISVDSATWNLGFLPSGETARIDFDATVNLDLPVGRNVIVNRAVTRAANEPPELRFNNSVTDTVVNLRGPEGSGAVMIEARPQEVVVGDSVSVRVRVAVPTEEWDLWVLFADGSIDSSYADAFVEQRSLAAEEWVDIVPKFADTRPVTDTEDEEIQFELRATDVLGVFRSARAAITLLSDNDLVIEQNVFAPGRDGQIEFRFRLSSNRQARLDLFDVAGSYVTRLAEGPFNAGMNTVLWNGETESGQKVGSGVYLVTLRSGGFTAMRKMMVVR